MSLSGVPPFAPLSTNDPRAEFQRLRELHSKGPSGYGSDREKETESRPSAAATALSDTSAIAANATRSAAVRKIDISV
ncbi:MAG TPA: hypothetical protein VHM01_01430 [Alphaproteobacteria bacterium]|nr:hypothetical protein [Alphaproteobacteria bacterium]